MTVGGQGGGGKQGSQAQLTVYLLSDRKVHISPLAALCLKPYRYSSNKISDHIVGPKRTH